MIVLASASPRRQELLRNAGIEFTVQPADVDEIPLPRESARECAERLAQEKAVKVWKTRPQDVVLGADTVVVVNGANLGKPVDANDAGRMLRLLAGRTHEVITGVCVAKQRVGEQWSVASDQREANVATASETTLVTMSQIPDQEILDYVATGEPMDKAGAYAIQGIASRWITRIEGDYSNVVGLPIALAYRMIRSAIVLKA
ncbi:MAG TPA: Maf family protein [Candidatus Binatia bacterium]|nr:Maf family protein [Candidatus Binatia bacterium]